MRDDRSSADLGPADRRIISDDEFDQIIADHSRYLKDPATEYNCKANFRSCEIRQRDLKDLNFEDTDFFNAYIADAGLKSSKLDLTDFRESHLIRVDFSGSSLAATRFRNARLRDCNLADVSGLQSAQLAGTDLSGSKIPEKIDAWEGLNQVAEISKHARAIFLAVVAGCVFSWLTLATTTDLGLIVNSATTPLPIIQTRVPIAGFFWAAPIILLAMYFYLHLYLQRLWDALGGLPAVFPDGRRLDERAYPWLLTSLVNAHVKLLRDRQRPAFSRLQVLFSIVAAWSLVPITLVLLWLRYLPRQDWPWTVAQVLLIAISIFAALIFYNRARAALRGEDLESSSPFAFMFRPPIPLYLGRAAGIGALCLMLSFGALNGAPIFAGGLGFEWRKVVPEMFFAIRYDVFADIRSGDVSQRPEGWTGRGDPKLTEERFAQVRGAQLSLRRFRYANFTGAFLVKADLGHADLKNAFLRNADFRRADLRNVEFGGAIVTRTDFRLANLGGADLSRVFGLTAAQVSQGCITENQPKLPKKLEAITLKKCPSGLF